MPVTRRVMLSHGAAAVAAGVIPPAHDTPAPDALRIRAEGIDALLARARASFAARQFDRAAYLAILRVLRDEEHDIHAQASTRTYDDLATHTYWHRSRLKFPSVTQQEYDRMMRVP
ncbi:MAG: hypothetical protein JNM38_10765 [Acidobacteria bacterium]|nr:hypothetical protein [Acidobacteriota bacterium]